MMMTPAARGPDKKRLDIKPVIKMEHRGHTRNISQFSTTVTGGNSRTVQGLSSKDNSFMASRMTGTDTARAKGAQSMASQTEQAKRALMNKVMPSGQQQPGA